MAAATGCAPGNSRRISFNRVTAARICLGWPRDLATDLGVGALLPALRFREELPKSLSHLSPHLLGFQHVSLTPTVSASAETLPTTESACQVKTYGSALEQKAGDRGASNGELCAGQRLEAP